MEHIYHEHQFGEHWFTSPGFYKFIVNKFSSNSHFVEVGSWKGKSSAFMAVEIINSGKNIKFDCIDLWGGNNVDGSQNNPNDNSLYDLFLNNMKPLEDYYKPFRISSYEGAKLYKDNSLDFVFIDANHSYEPLKQDIQVWLPKIKKGGIISGHDYIPHEHGAFPEVIKAVQEMFKLSDIKVLQPDQHIWYVEI
jgi:hypothetical protein